jgi:hypothetical protein
MAFKNMSGAQHMNAEVAAMSAMVFSQYTHLVEAGACIGYGDQVEENDDPMEALVLDLLVIGKPSAGAVDLMVRKHLKVVDSDSEITALMKSVWMKKL